MLPFSYSAHPHAEPKSQKSFWLGPGWLGLMRERRSPTPQKQRPGSIDLPWPLLIRRAKALDLGTQRPCRKGKPWLERPFVSMSGGYHSKNRLPLLIPGMPQSQTQNRRVGKDPKNSPNSVLNLESTLKIQRV